jgi:hypothetical protein
MYTSRCAFSSPGHLLKKSGQLHFPAALPRAKRSRYPMDDRRLDGPQNRLGEKRRRNSHPYPHRVTSLRRPARRETTASSARAVAGLWASWLQTGQPPMCVILE